LLVSINCHIPYYNGTSRGRQCWQQPVSAIRSGDLKHIYNDTDQSVELSNVVNDMAESKNLAGSMPEKASELKKKLDVWLKETKAPMLRKWTPEELCNRKGIKK
jgi:hypothetical protein